MDPEETVADEALKKLVTCDCTALYLATAQKCWLCGTPLPCAASSTNDAAFVLSPRPEARRTPFQFGMTSLLLVTALCAVLFGVIREFPGLGIVLAIISAPALLRTWMLISCRKLQGEPMTVPDKCWAFIGSFVVVIVVGISAVSAFLITCLPFDLFVGFIPIIRVKVGVSVFGLLSALVAAAVVGRMVAIRFWSRAWW